MTTVTEEQTHTHHWVPRQEGHLGGEPTFIQTCDCGATYRNGRVLPAPAPKEQRR